MAISFGNPERIESIINAVGYYPSVDLKSVENATIPLLSFLIHHFDKFGSIVKSIGFSGDYDLLLKCPVRSPKGKGHPSTSDIMIRSSKGSASMEAVWFESLGPSVGTWLTVDDEREKTNHQNVLAGWLQYLGSHMNQPLGFDEIAEVNYRMLHRAASAASMNANPSIMYLFFTAGQDDHRFTECLCQLKRLKDQLRLVDNFGVYVTSIETTPTQHYNQFKGIPPSLETAELMRIALQEPERLFDFSEPEIIRI